MRCRWHLCQNKRHSLGRPGFCGHSSLRSVNERLLHCWCARELSQPSEFSEDCLLLTFERRVLYFLLDFGKFHHVSCFLSENELPLPCLEAFPVVFNDRDTVLQGGDRHYEGTLASRGRAAEYRVPCYSASENVASSTPAERGPNRFCINGFSLNPGSLHERL